MDLLILRLIFRLIELLDAEGKVSEVIAAGGAAAGFAGHLDSGEEEGGEDGDDGDDDEHLDESKGGG